MLLQPEHAASPQPGAEQNGCVLSKPASTNSHTKSLVLLSSKKYQCLVCDFVFGNCGEPQSVMFPLSCFLKELCY